MNATSKIIRTALLAATLGLFLSAESVANDIKGDGGRVRLLYNEPGTNSFPPFVIKKFALDKKYGFELQPIPVSTSQATANALQAGGGDIGILDWITLARMQSRGVKLVGVAPFLIWANTVIVRTNSPIQNLGDLKGKKVGIYSRNNLDWVVMRTHAQRQYSSISKRKRSFTKVGCRCCAA